MRMILMMNNPWKDIKIPSHDVAARRIDHKHPMDFFWAKDQTGRYLFFCELSEDIVLPEKLPKLKGFDLLKSDAGKRLILGLRDKNDWELFLALCNDIVTVTKKVKNSASSITIILNRLDKWHHFLKKNRREILSEEEIKGLIGELVFIKDHLLPVFGTSQAIRFWQGPEGLPQDFNVNNSAIEVKCQSGSSTPFIKISSIEQLCPQFPEMYLFVVTLGKTNFKNSNAINLPVLINQIRQLLVNESSDQLERFSDLLFNLGYIDSEIYYEYSYLLTDQKMYKVYDDFPRICPSEIHSGILKLSYSIKLSSCKSFENKPNWMEIKP